MGLKGYVVNLYHDVPLIVYGGLLTILLGGAVSIIYVDGFRKGCEKIGKLMLSLYIYLIYCSTVIYRQQERLSGSNFQLFWSYQAIKEGREDLIYENIMNVLVFLPVGILLCSTFSKIKWWQVILIGLSISVSIEALQYVFKKGYSEFDDVFHNVLGCILGFFFYQSFKWIINGGRRFFTFLVPE